MLSPDSSNDAVACNWSGHLSPATKQLRLGLRRKIQAHKSSKQWVAKAISPGGRKPTLVGDGHKPLAVSPAVRALLGSKSLRQ